jgi:hypothetical protein
LPDLSGEYDWVAFNSAVTMVHVSAADLEAQGVTMTWLPDDTSLWITGHHVPVANLWCVEWRCHVPPPPPRAYRRARAQTLLRPPATTAYLPRVFFPAAHCRYFSSRMLPLYRALKLNSTGTLGMHLPPLASQDYLYMPLPEEYVMGRMEDASVQVCSGLLQRYCWPRTSRCCSLCTVTLLPTLSVQACTRPMARDVGPDSDGHHRHVTSTSGLR